MLALLFLVGLAAVVLLAVARLKSRVKMKKKDPPYSLVAVLGSGGHTR